MITLSIGNIFTDVLGDLPEDRYTEMERCLSYRTKDYQHTKAYNTLIRNKDGKVIGRLWDGWTKQCWKNKNRVYFPTGLVSIAREYLDKMKIEYRCVVLRIKPDPNLPIDFTPQKTFYEHQKDAISRACEKTRGIIQVPTGGGKTTIGGGIISQLDVSPFLFFVTSKDLLTQAKESLQEDLLLHGSPLKVGQIGAGILDIADVNVMTIQTAVRCLGKDWKKYKKDSEDTDDKINEELLARRKDILELMHEAKGSICDEVQHWKADTCLLVARELHNCYYTYGMSATPFRDDGDDMLIQSCFGRIIYQISASELIRRDLLVRPSIKMLSIRQPRSSYRQWANVYQEQVVENEPYNEMIAKIANKYAETGRLVLVLTQRVPHGERLAGLINGAKFLYGDSPKDERRKGIEQLRNHEISCIVSTTIFDEGIDVKPLDTVIAAGQGKSRVRAMQRVGRVMRKYTSANGKQKDHATVIDPILRQKFLEDHGNERRLIYKTEPEFDVTDREVILK